MDGCAGIHWRKDLHMCYTRNKLGKGFIPNQSTDLYILTNSCPGGGWSVLKIHCNEQVPLSLQSRKSNRVQN